MNWALRSELGSEPNHPLASEVPLGKVISPSNLIGEAWHPIISKVTNISICLSLKITALLYTLVYTVLLFPQLMYFDAILFFF